MKLLPLTGKCLLEVLPADYQTGSGLHLPDIATVAAQGMKSFPCKARVVAIGPWKKTKRGLAMLPDFKPGDTVILSHYVGSSLTRDIDQNYRICRVDDVMATLTEPDATIGY